MYRVGIGEVLLADPVEVGVRGEKTPWLSGDVEPEAVGPESSPHGIGREIVGLTHRSLPRPARRRGGSAPSFPARTAAPAPRPRRGAGEAPPPASPSPP